MFKNLRKYGHSGKGKFFANETTVAHKIKKIISNCPIDDFGFEMIAKNDMGVELRNGDPVDYEFRDKDESSRKGTGFVGHIMLASCKSFSDTPEKPSFVAVFCLNDLYSKKFVRSCNGKPVIFMAQTVRKIENRK